MGEEPQAMPKTLNPKLVSWASDIDPETIRQAEKTARLPIVEGHVALMPDAHVGIGATVGAVIPTTGAVIPSAVRVVSSVREDASGRPATERHLPPSQRSARSPAPQTTPPPGRRA